MSKNIAMFVSLGRKPRRRLHLSHFTSQGVPTMNRRAFVAGISSGLLLKLLGTGRSAAEEMAPDVEQTVEKGLNWLVSKQEPDGHWKGSGGQYMTALTGMAGLAFLMEGSTLREGKYAKQIQKAVDWTLNKSNPSGLIAGEGGPGSQRYSTHGHGFALLFLASVYGEEEGTDRRKKLEVAITKAVDWSVKAQTKAGGWYYTSADDSGGDKDEGSTTVTQLQAIRAARNAGIVVPYEVITRAQKYLENCTGPNDGIYYSPQFKQEKPAITAAGIVCGFSLGDYDSKIVKKWIKYCQKNLNTLGDGRMGHDEYAHYYWAQALYAMGENRYLELFPGTSPQDCVTWSKYRKPTFDYLIKEQDKNDGKWTGAGGAWSHIGPVYVTSLYLAILQLDKGILPIYMR
jgi:hypothetical protein